MSKRTDQLEALIAKHDTLYPEHAKAERLREQLQGARRILTYLLGEQGLVLGLPVSEYIRGEYVDGYLRPQERYTTPTNEMGGFALDKLHEAFGINHTAWLDERAAMRAALEASPPDIPPQG